jgi:uncharacterized protein (TIGR03086 family)
VHELQILARACGEFDRRLRDTDVPLDAKTPCEGWTVQDLLQHVIVGNRVAVVMLEGRSQEEVAATRADLLERNQVIGDPAAAFAESAAAQVAAFAAPDALERTVHHHALGDLPGQQLATFRICDLTLHAWDLARATGADESFHHVLVEWVYDAMAPGAAAIAAGGQFGDGPSGTLPDDSPLLLRLLDLSGRRP